MAPHKRRREEEVIEIETASSSLRQSGSTSKRIRRVGGGPDLSDRAVVSADQDDDDGCVPLGATQYEKIRDGDFLHLQNPDLDDQIATQKLLARSREFGDNHPADNGIIEKITCINFMCHDKLEVELGPLLNFIVGMNGSGKSAVLTAITLCLGGKASSTSRGSSIKSFVKEGKDQALLIIKLKNEGVDAYQPLVYGPSIIIERHFSKTGSGGFRLKNATGRGVISSKKGDIDDVVEYFNMQLDNPLNILTQDAAKTFIKDSTPKSKYDFYYRGTQLEQLDNDYRLVHDTCDRIEHSLEDTKDDLIALRTKMEDATAKREFMEQHEPMRKNARMLARQVAWVQVQDQEEDLDRRGKNVVAIQEDIHQKQLEVEENSVGIHKLDELVAKGEGEVDQLLLELQPLEKEEQEAKDSSQAAAKVDQQAHVMSTEIAEQLNAAQASQRKIEEDIADERRRLESVNGGAHTQTLSRMEQAKDLQQRSQQSLSENAVNRAPQDELHKARQEEHTVKSMLNGKVNEIKECRLRLEASRQQQPDLMRGYHSGLPQLLRNIQSDRGFQSPVIGPMGLHIKLKRPEWSSILERFFGNSLNGFVVASKADQVRLSRMLQSKDISCPIFIFSGTRKAFDTTGKEPSPQYDTIMRVLDIDNVVVRNQLIVSHAIDQTLLIARKVDADRVMFDGPSPRNVRACYRLNPNKRGWGVRLTRTGHDRSNPAEDSVAAWDKAARMMTETENQITFLEESLEQLEGEKTEIENRFRVLRQAVAKSENALRMHEDAARRFKIEEQRARDSLSKLQAEYDRYSIEDGHLDALMEELDRAKEEVDRIGNVYGKAVLHQKDMNGDATEAKRGLNAARKRVQSHNSTIEEARSKSKRLADARKNVELERNTALCSLADLEETKRRAISKVEQQQRQVEKITEQAAAACPDRVPIEEGATYATLASKLKSLTKQLAAYRNRQGVTDDQIIDEYANATADYKRMKTQREKMEELHILLRGSFEQRMTQFQRFQKLIGARSRISFQYLLSERAFRGTLIIDHEQRKLDVQVEPDDTIEPQKSTKGRAPKGLSGGEKSYTSVCLLLALWEAMGAPLRCLDEFDVWMDDVNRDVSTKMIISAARSAVSRQFILITPKALGQGVDVGPDVKITKLWDPRQRRIDTMITDPE